MVSLEKRIFIETEEESMDRGVLPCSSSEGTIGIPGAARASATHADLGSNDSFQDWVVPLPVDALGRPLGYSLLAVLRRRSAPVLTMVVRLLPF